MKLCNIFIIVFLMSIGFGYADKDPIKLKVNWLESLCDGVSQGEALYEISFAPDKIPEFIYEGSSLGVQGKYFLSIKGEFDVEWNYTSNKCSVESGPVDCNVEITLPLRSMSKYHSLLPLTKSDSVEEYTNYFFIARGSAEQKSVFDLHYYGPFAQEERFALREILACLVDLESKEVGGGLWEDHKLSVSKSKWRAILKLFVLKKQGRLSAVDFVSDPELIQNDDVMIINDLLYEIAAEGHVRETLPDAIKSLAENDDMSTSVLALNYMTKLASENSYIALRLQKYRGELEDYYYKSKNVLDNERQKCLSDLLDVVMEDLTKTGQNASIEPVAHPDEEVDSVRFRERRELEKGSLPSPGWSISVPEKGSEKGSEYQSQRK